MDHKKGPFVVACIPAYNEEATISRIIIETKKYVDSIIVCDDGSQDYTGEIAQELGAIVVRHNANLGYGAALRSLFTEAIKLDADVLVTVDGDGQHDPKFIPILLDSLQSTNADIVIGSRFLEGGGSNAPRWRTYGIKLITEIASNGKKITDGQSGFRAYNKNAQSALRLTEQGMGVSTEILMKAFDLGLKIVEVPIIISYGRNTSSNNPIIHGLDVMLSIIKHASIKRPILFYCVPGFFATIIGALFWVITISNYTIYKTLSTNLSLIALSGTIIGLTLMNTGLILWVIIGVLRESM